MKHSKTLCLLLFFGITVTTISAQHETHHHAKKDRGIYEILK